VLAQRLAQEFSSPSFWFNPPVVQNNFSPKFSHLKRMAKSKYN